MALDDRARCDPGPVPIRVAGARHVLLGVGAALDDAGGNRRRSLLAGVRRVQATTKKQAPGGDLMTTSTATASEVEVLRDLNGHYIRSVVHSDVARFTEILADDFLCTNPDGSLIDKPQFLRQTAVLVSFTDFDVDDLRIRRLGDVAIIHGKTRFARSEERRVGKECESVCA